MNTALGISRSPVEAGDLRPVGLLRDLDSADLGRLTKLFAELEVPGGSLIVQEGEHADCFFVVAEGALVVFRDTRGEPVQLLDRLYKGDYFGELGLFGGGRHCASVRASVPSRVLRITKEGFLHFLTDHPLILETLQTSAARKHSANVASSLELGRRREVRMRCSREVEIRLAGGETRQVVVENLSVGGICLSGAPQSWEVSQEVSFSIAVRENELHLKGKVVWKFAHGVGISFTKQTPNHDMIVQMAVRLLVESPC